MTVVRNRKRRPRETKRRIYLVHIDSRGRAHGVQLTPFEYRRGRRRNERNPEDVPEWSIAVQVIRGRSCPTRRR